MRIIHTVDLEQSSHTLFVELLAYLNAHPYVNHVTLKGAFLCHATTKEESRLHTLAVKIMDEMKYAIDPPPTIDVFTSSSSMTVSTEQAVAQESFSIGHPDVFVASIDFDGCSDTQHGKQHIIDDVLKCVAQYPSIKHIAVIIGSLRQSLACDYMNAVNNAVHHGNILLSCHGIGADLTDKLRSAVAACEDLSEKPTVEFDPFMMSDIFNYLEEGTTYKALHRFHEKLRQGEKPKQFVIRSLDDNYVDLLGMSTHSKVTHSFEWNDKSKISTLITQMHHFAQKYTEKPKIHFRFYDDRLDILTTLNDYFKAGLLIPSTVTFDSVQNDEYMLRVPFAPIQGVGEVISNYSAMLFELAMALPEPSLRPYLEANIVSFYVRLGHDYGATHITESIPQTHPEVTEEATTTVDSNTSTDREELCVLQRPIAVRPGDARFFQLKVATVSRIDALLHESILDGMTC